MKPLDDKVLLALYGFGLLFWLLAALARDARGEGVGCEQPGPDSDEAASHCLEGDWPL